MDLSTLKKNIMPYLDKARVYGEKATKQARVYGEKALDFTQRQVQGTPIFLKDEESYNIHSSAKRSITIAYDETAPVSQEILLLAPVWATKAWMDNADLRYISLTGSPELARNIGIVGPVEMRVAFVGYESLRTNDMDTMKQWWNRRQYQKDEGEKGEGNDRIETVEKKNHPKTGVIGKTKKAPVKKDEDPLGNA